MAGHAEGLKAAFSALPEGFLPCLRVMSIYMVYDHGTDLLSLLSATYTPSMHCEIL